MTPLNGTNGNTMQTFKVKTAAGLRVGNFNTALKNPPLFVDGGGGKPQQIADPPDPKRQKKRQKPLLVEA